MSAIAPLLTAIKARADSDTGAGGLFETGAPLITGWYSMLHPQQTTTDMTIYPYVVVFPIDHRRDNVFETDKWSDEIFLQFSVFCDGSRDLTVDQAVVDRIITRFDRWAPTFTGWTPNQLIHDGSNLLQLDDNLRHHIYDFRCGVAKG